MPTQIVYEFRKSEPINKTRINTRYINRIVDKHKQVVRDVLPVVKLGGPFEKVGAENEAIGGGNQKVGSGNK